MARPRFSEMLVERRRALGLSIAQASSVLKLKERALVAFEEGDFAHMPKSGYAQGMLASYSRYLGLNPRTVSQQFSRDMADWERAGGRDLARSRHVDASVGMPRREGFRGSQGLLPTSGGYAGDMGGFATTSPVRPKGQSSPLVRRGTAGADDWERRYTSRDLSSPPSRASSRYARARRTPRRPRRPPARRPARTRRAPRRPGTSNVTGRKASWQRKQALTSCRWWTSRRWTTPTSRRRAS
ncbi:helix-turn-helix domain-containing protein [Olsenella massiliensis]|uniref:helix-turn-helix domain-containing protein n=1 Tax=Olsenella massiliensis TaxID=1622075 RepID=UPI0009EB2C62|nr:helix-turn-helix transcriptional regulator [Olsenella massiliensis]